MQSKQQLLSASQASLVADLAGRYGIDPSEITFFTDDPKPFLGYEATCVMLGRLRPDLVSIDIEPIETSFVDSLSLRCSLTFADGRHRSAVGVVNVAEQLDGKPMSSQQLYQAASGRAIRNALRTAGIDIVKLHAESVDDPKEVSSPKTERAALLAQVHALGKEVGLISAETGKEHWSSFLMHRYGVASSSQLGTELLADLAATLRTLNSPFTNFAA